MNSTTYSDDHPDPIVMIAACLTDHFVQSFYNLQSEKGYCVYLGCVSEIIDWATEFYDEYYYKLKNWESFERSMENIYRASSQHAFLIYWGKNRIRQFSMEL